MSQMPPPPSEPTPAPMGGTPSASGSNTKTYVILAYLFWWITGLIFLFVGKDDPDVKWNAAQSVVILGGLWVIGFVLNTVHLLPLGALVYLVALIYWIIFLVGAFNFKGGHIEAPLIGQFTNRWTDAVANLVK